MSKMNVLITQVYDCLYWLLQTVSNNLQQKQNLQWSGQPVKVRTERDIMLRHPRRKKIILRTFWKDNKLHVGRKTWIEEIAYLIVCKCFFKETMHTEFNFRINSFIRNFFLITHGKDKKKIVQPLKKIWRALNLLDVVCPTSFHEPSCIIIVIAEHWTS